MHDYYTKNMEIKGKIIYKIWLKAMRLKKK